MAETPVPTCLGRRYAAGFDVTEMARHAAKAVSLEKVFGRPSTESRLVAVLKSLLRPYTKVPLARPTKRQFSLVAVADGSLDNVLAEQLAAAPSAADLSFF